MINKGNFTFILTLTFASFSKWNFKALTYYIIGSSYGFYVDAASLMAYKLY